MPRKGKDFELLIKKLEGILLPVGAIITSPDYIEDKVTGTRRETDISIKYAYDDCMYTTIIECRDRSSTQDVTWIEQLVTKTRDTGVSKVIAVSSAGFSENAIKKASHYEIELKTYKEIMQENVDWFVPAYIVICDRKHTILSAVINLGDIKPIDPSPFENKQLSEIFLLRIRDNKIIDLSEFLQENIPIQSVFSQLPLDESSHVLKICIPMDENNGGYNIESDGCFYAVQQVEILVDFCTVIRKVPVSKKTIYSGQLGNSTQVIEFGGSFPGQYSTLQLIKAEDGSIYISSSDPSKPH